MNYLLAFLCLIAVLTLLAYILLSNPGLILLIFIILYIFGVFDYYSRSWGGW